jgi:4-hydroxythreonine-4-phosphate dehydrogenase
MSKEQKNINKPRIGITIGDPNGIGIELILKTFLEKRLLDFCTPIIYGSGRIISFHRKALNLEDVKLNTLKAGVKINFNGINLVNCWEDDVKIELGKGSPEAAKYAYKALEVASQDLKDNKIDAIITGPIDKNLISKAIEQKFVGQTEYFAEKSGTKNPLMIMVADKLKVAIATGHIPVTEIGTKLTTELIVDKLKSLNKSLIEDFGIDKPKIAVLGLNPHAGDGGLLGSEEQEIIVPAIEKVKKENIIAVGPYSADGYFGAIIYKQFDAVLAMYHDQGLAPFKSLAFDDGVNFTAGLPIIRTSPDHGPAFNLAGKSIAEEGSMRSSVFCALNILKHRRNHKEHNQNKLDRTALFKGLDGKDDPKSNKKESAKGTEV